LQGEVVKNRSRNDGSEKEKYQDDQREIHGIWRFERLVFATTAKSGLVLLTSARAKFSQVCLI
jgi:hypothetical protein